MSKILIIEDEVAIADLEKDYLELSDFKVDICNTGDVGLKTALAGDYDLIILDLMLPGMDGFEVCKKIREEKNIPILMVSAKKDDIDKIRGLGLGADDYMTKPFHREELVARIAAIIRRSKGHSQAVIRTGDLVVNLDARSVEVHGKPVNLTGKEYQILELLSLRKGTTLTKEMFLNHLYGGMDEPELKIIDVFICKLRKKLALACNGENYIETVWGRGYVLRDIDDEGNEVRRVA